MGDVTLLWFACSNPECNFIPIKNKKEKIKRYWKNGQSIQTSARARIFMRYVEGRYQWLDNGNIMIFNCKYGKICMYNKFDTEPINGWIYPIEGKEMCYQCQERLKNDGVMFQ